MKFYSNKKVFIMFCLLFMLQIEKDKDEQFQEIIISD